MKNLSQTKKDFKELISQYEKDDRFREKIILITREITKLSKKSIYSQSRGDSEEAKVLLNKAEKEKTKTEKIIKDSKIELMHILKSGLEEYVEAKLFYEYMTSKKILTSKQIKVPYEIYLLAMSDFSGEIAKLSVSLATKGEFSKVKEIKDTIEEIYGLYLNFDFRSGELRKKFDSLKYNLNKVESIIYDIELKK